MADRLAVSTNSYHSYTLEEALAGTVLIEVVHERGDHQPARRAVKFNDSSEQFPHRGPFCVKVEIERTQTCPLGEDGIELGVRSRPPEARSVHEESVASLREALPVIL